MSWVDFSDNCRRRCVSIGQFIAPFILATFSAKEHAMLIGKTLEFHNIDPKGCLSIMISKEINKSTPVRKAITEAFKQMYDTTITYYNEDIQESLNSVFEEMFGLS